jgi:hypothetical protein
MAGSASPDRKETGPHWWRRVKRFFREAFAQPTGRPTTTSGRPPATPRENLQVEIHPAPEIFEFTTPALGEAFSFMVSVRADWCARKTAAAADRRKAVEQELTAAVDRLRADLRRRVETRIRPVARSYPPYRPDALEAHLLGDSTIHCLRDGEVTCNLGIQVAAEEPVRQQLVASTFNRMALYNKGRLSADQAAQLTELRLIWDAFLQSGFESKDQLTFQQIKRKAWFAPYAVALAENPTQVAVQVDNMLARRVEQAENLFKDLGDVVSDHQSLDLMDFAFQTDNALRRVLEGLGILLTDATPDSPVAGPS